MTANEANTLNELLGEQVAIEMKIAPTALQMKRKPQRVGRNEPCPCGSGKKFKRCCLLRKPMKLAAESEAREERNCRKHE
ncbi:MAG: SEC-C metal-binding domain-containing protein [Pseudomonadota bacterium]